MEAMADTVSRAPVPPVIRAAWLAFTTMTIHPFVDGNGRSARALFLAESTDGLEAVLDWGVLEQWSLRRFDYVSALQVGQRGRRFSDGLLDAGETLDCVDGLVEIGYLQRQGRPAGYGSGDEDGQWLTPGPAVRDTADLVARSFFVD